MKEYKFMTELNNSYTIDVPLNVLDKLTLNDKLHVIVRVKEDK